MANSTARQSKRKPTAEPWPAKPKTNRQAPTHWLKSHGRHRARGLNRCRAIKERSTAINNDWADNQACSLPHNTPPNLHTKSPQNSGLDTPCRRSTPRPTPHRPNKASIRDKTPKTPHEAQNNDSPAQEARQQGLHHGI